MPVVRGKNIEQLFSAEVIASRNKEMAEEIVKGKTNDLLVISVLKGSFIFAADLIRGHGGRLDLMRSDSEGTEFQISLPREISRLPE
mgnify:CR=1 FL=1